MLLTVCRVCRVCHVCVVVCRVCVACVVCVGSHVRLMCGVVRALRKREEVEMDEDGDRFKTAKNFVAIDVSSDSEGEADEEEVLEDYLTRRYHVPLIIVIYHYSTYSK